MHTLCPQHAPLPRPTSELRGCSLHTPSYCTHSLLASTLDRFPQATVQGQTGATHPEAVPPTLGLWRPPDTQDWGGWDTGASEKDLGCGRDSTTAFGRCYYRCLVSGRAFALQPDVASSRPTGQTLPGPMELSPSGFSRHGFGQVGAHARFPAAVKTLFTTLPKRPRRQRKPIVAGCAQPSWAQGRNQRSP